MSRVARSIVLRNFARCELAVSALENHEQLQRLQSATGRRSAAQQLLSAYRAYGQAASAAAQFYREGSAARRFAESAARLAEKIVTAMQRELALMDGA